MLRESIVCIERVSLLTKDKKTCARIADFIIVQCLIVFVGAATIGLCVWSPEYSTYDYDKLIRIMYLYDPRACGFNIRASNSIKNLQLSNNTKGTNVLSIAWMPAVVTVTTRLSAKTRRYINLSVFIHILWMIAVIFLRIFKGIKRIRIVKIIISIVLYATISVITFDISMAIVYIAHIQQSLTKGMIIRYSGWSVEMKIKNYNGFGGWLPIGASICWMRGVIILALNIYCCRKLRQIRSRIKKREVKKRLVLEENKAIPEPRYEEPKDDKVLYFRTGEYKPYVKEPQRRFMYYF